MAPSRSFSFAPLVVLAALLGFGVASGCGSEDRADAWGGSGGGDHPLPGNEPCAVGDSRECHVTLDERNGILTCMSGTQACEGGIWGECQGGTLSEQSAPSWYRAGGLRPQQAATPVDCMPDNPCDPSCQQYDDDDDLVPDSETNPGAGGAGSDGYDWQWGSLSAFPAGLVKKGIIEPCSSSYDCQFNMYCNGPTQGSCAHSICATGATLTSGCDDETSTEYPCTELICDVDPTCCGASASSCAHDPCVTGVALDASCTGCVEQICDDPATASCCTTSWTQACVDAVETTCGNTCGCPSGWGEYGGSCYRAYTASSEKEKFVDAKTKCNSATTGGYLAIITTAGEQAHVASLGGEMWIGLDRTGGSWVWVDGTTLGTPQYFDVSPNNNIADASAPASADSQAAYMGTDDFWATASDNSSSTKKNYACESTTNMVMSGTWGDSCVEKVKTVCGSYCDDPVSGEENTGQGECVPYPAGYIDPDCAGVNLTVAPTCSTGGTYVIPVCNHGQSTLSASPASPVRIISYQGNSSHYPSTTPGVGSGDKVQDTCFLEEDIAPGECVMVGGCDLDNNGAVIINAQTSGLTNPSPITECNYADNWSLVKKANNGGTDVSCTDVPCGQYDGYYDELTTGSCSMAVPAQAEYEDSDLVTLSHVFDNGNSDENDDEPVEFTYVSTSATCGSVSGGLGWYYDDPADPATITLCPNACARVQDTATYSGGSEVYVSAACAGSEPTTVYEETTFYFTYEGNCGVDRGVQWQDLGYVADIPAGSSVSWYVAASGDASTLPGEPVDLSDPDWHLAGTSDEDAEESCPTNTTPSCALDVYTALGGLPDAQLQYLAVAVVITPTGDGSAAPTVSSFNVTYSCPFNQ